KHLPCAHCGAGWKSATGQSSVCERLRPCTINCSINLHLTRASMRRRRTAMMMTLMATCAGTLPASCHADLVNTGDLAFIGFNADGLDDFAIVLLADASAGTVVHFNDNSW